MIKVIMMLVMFVDGEARGIFDPAPNYETMQQCVDDFAAHEKELIPDEDGVLIRAACVSATEIKVLR